MKTTEAQIKSITDGPKTIHGTKVWPLAYGHRSWLIARKNKVVLGLKNVNDFSIAEFCFAFTKDALSLQNINGVSATKAINDFLFGSSEAKLAAILKHAFEQVAIYQKTMVAPKKAQAAKSRKKTT
jgi:hypothetical protein